MPITCDWEGDAASCNLLTRADSKWRRLPRKVDPSRMRMTSSRNGQAKAFAIFRSIIGKYRDV